MHISLNSHARRALALAIAWEFASPARAVTITVTTNDDLPLTAPCNLRNAITAINFGNAVSFPGCRNSLTGAFGDNDTIVFAAALANSTITLQQGQMANYAPLTIAGSGQVLYAARVSRVLYTTAFLSLSNLSLTGGDAGTSAGGGLYSKQALVTLNNVRVTSNRAGSAGGGLAIENGSATLTGTEVTGNSSNGGYGGAGLFVSAAAVTLTMSTLADNAAVCVSHCGGGLAITNGSTLTMTASTLARNTITGSGTVIAGAIYANDSKVTVINSTIAGNRASGHDAVAGAIVENQSSAIGSYGAAFTNATVSSNSAAATSAGAASGGALIGVSGTGRLALANAIFAANHATIANSASSTPDLVVSGTATASNSLLGNALIAAYAGNGNIFSDNPGLASLSNNGGKTETLALLGSSPAIDAGNNALAVDAAAQPLSADQRGMSRVINGRVDIGAFEYPGDHIFADGFGS